MIQVFSQELPFRILRYSQSNDKSMRRLQYKSHLRARIDSRAPADSKTAAILFSTPRVLASGERSPVHMEFRGGAYIERRYNLNDMGGWDSSFLYPGEAPLNFSPLRAVSQGIEQCVDRRVREVPWESKEELLRRIVRPEFSTECDGTPRREYQGGMMQGIRVRPVANPFFQPRGQLMRQYDRWNSRNLCAWNPKLVSVRGGTRRYSIPQDILPKKDELGEWSSPCLSGRYQADVRRQYTLHGIPWIYKRDFFANKQHILDKEPVGPKRWYKREYRQAKIRQAMSSMRTQVEEYRKERKAAKKKTWFEQIVQKLVGSQVSSKYIVERKLPKL
jgi:hypothetical protein